MNLEIFWAFAAIVGAGSVGYICGGAACVSKLRKLVGPEEWERIRRQW